MKETVSDLKPEIFEVYSDGACSPNPGIGGYGYVLRFLKPSISSPSDSTEVIITGSEGFKSTTNNRMELQGCMEGLIKAMDVIQTYRNFYFELDQDYLDWKIASMNNVAILSEEKNPAPDVCMRVTVQMPFKQINVLSDSSYLCRGFERGWVKKWKLSGWKTSDGSPVKNIDLWQGIDRMLDRLKTEYGMKHHFICVPGHRGYKFNEVCDQLAVAARKALRNP